MFSSRPDDGCCQARPAGMDDVSLDDTLLELLSTGVDALLALLEDDVRPHGGTDV